MSRFSELSTAAAPQPVLTREEAIDWIGLSRDIYEHDDILDVIVLAVTDYIQSQTSQRVFPEQWLYSLWNFPPWREPIWIPLAPVTALTTLTYLDDQETPAQQPYVAQLAGDVQQYVVPARGENWPTETAKPYPGNVRLTLQIGPPQPLIWAQICARKLASQWFDTRSGVVDVQFNKVPHDVDRLLTANRLPDAYTSYEVLSG